VANENNWKSRLRLSDVPVQLPKIVHALLPSVLFGEKAKIIRRLCGAAVAAMVIGIDCVTRCGKLFRQSRVASGMFCQPMRNLHHSYWRSGW
jgi:hypothetical protein